MSRDKQSSVEWLIKQFNLQNYLPHIEQAKAMHKQEIEDAELRGKEIIIIKHTEHSTPIELPSDEEIGEFINTFPYTKQLDDGQFNDGVIYGATIGIDWMRDKIQGGNYEQQ